MDRNQHLVQDAAEHYATWILQREAERLGLSQERFSSVLREKHLAYLQAVGLTEEDFEFGEFPRYKANADAQLPAFVERIAKQFQPRNIEFENVEASYRNLGLKGDFIIRLDDRAPISVSLKNYIGAGGITRPQVSSGTFLSFAAGFVFERVGVGQYVDPRPGGKAFRGSDRGIRDSVLAFQGREYLSNPLWELQSIGDDMREELLSESYEFYDKNAVKVAAQRSAERGIIATLELFELLGEERVRGIFLARAGLDGQEEALFFDAERYVDSITNQKYHALRVALNDVNTELKVVRHKQGIRFEFTGLGGPVLRTDVPFTINTNGAWYRPKARYAGTRDYNDKGHVLALAWGQRRPYKSKEIATSTNMYVNLAKLGLFGPGST